MTSTVPPLAESARLPRESRREPVGEVLGRAPIPLAVAAAAMAAGWAFTSNLLYLGGLILALIWAMVVLERPRNRWLVALSILGVGLGGPCLGVVLSYRDAGVLVDADLQLLGTSYITTQGDAVVLTGFVAVDGDGREAWSLRGGGAYRDQVALGDGSFLVAGLQDYALVDANGVPAWAVSVEPYIGEVAAVGGGALVVRTCDDTEDGVGCTWTGFDLADGTTRWEVAGRPAPAWPVPDSDVLGGSGTLLSPPSVFGVTGESGATELRDAGTGRVIEEVPGAATVLLARDAAVVVDLSGPCRAELWDGDGGGWTTEVDCALMAALPAAPFTAEELTVPALVEGLGTLVGQTWWASPPPPGDESLVLDLGTGAARTVPGGSRVYGAGVVVEQEGDDFTVRDPLDGSRLWGVTRDGYVIGLGGDLVVFWYDAPLLLDQLFGPEYRDSVVEVREARTGDVVARLRADGSVVVADDRIFVEVERTPDVRTVRMIMAD